MHALVLVVDDDEAARVVLSELLRRSGIDVHCACDGAEALEWLRGGDVPDLLLLDLAMPNVDGWRVLAALRADARLEALPVVVLTSFSDTENLPAGIPSIHKPIEPDLLLESVNAQLS